MSPGTPLIRQGLNRSQPFTRNLKPVLHKGQAGAGLFDGADPMPYCSRCRREYATLIVGSSLDDSTDLCATCWGRTR
jgi:hypothetical protein